MFKNAVTVIVGAVCAVYLSACGADAGSADEKVGSTAAALETYTHIWDVYEGGSSGGVPYRDPLFDPQATNEMIAWGMPLQLEDYCVDHPTYSGCVPSSGHPHPAWVRVRYSASGSWSAWLLLADASISNQIGTAGGYVNGVPTYCSKFVSGNFNNNWFCTQSAGGQGGYQYIESKYGQ